MLIDTNVHDLLITTMSETCFRMHKAYATQYLVMCFLIHCSEYMLYSATSLGTLAILV